jgi:predicted NUDIX family phosphoesterase/shikimate kinase
LIREEAEEFAQIFLRVAEAVLVAAHSPLTAREIVERGIERGLFGDHVLGRTPEKSMQARLSLNIKHLRESSRFMRVARGRFLMRSHLGDPVRDSQIIGERVDAVTEYISESRKLKFPSENVLCTPERQFQQILTFQGIDSEFDVLLPRLLSNTIYIDRAKAEDRNDSKQFITYVIVQCGHRIMSFRRSYISRAAEFLRGAKCIGFGGHVSAADNDIFSSADCGLQTCARRELSEELTVGSLKSGRSYASASLFRDAPLECLGVLNDDSSEVGRRHLAVVYRLWINDWETAKLISKGESALHTLQWIDLTIDKIDITECEYWSQLCLRRFYSSNIVSEPIIKHLNIRTTRRARALVIAGRIGSGKSEIGRFLAQRLNAHVVSSGEELQKLIGAPSIQVIGREEFQRRADQFIRSPGGPERLGEKIAQAVAASPGDRVVIDGLRQPETFAALSALLADQTALLYVHTPPDIAYEMMYRLRETPQVLDFPYRDFLRIFDAPVEADLPSLGRLAHTYIYNYLGLDALRRLIDKLISQIS